MNEIKISINVNVIIGYAENYSAIFRDKKRGREITFVADPIWNRLWIEEDKMDAFLLL